MIRTFEYDDFPYGKDIFFDVVDDFHKKFPDFKCNVFAIPDRMNIRLHREIQKRPFLRLNPHGFTHEKGECRQEGPILTDQQKQMLGIITEDERWTNTFKPPWHGGSPEFLDLIADMGFAPTLLHAHQLQHPAPTWKAYFRPDREAQSKCCNVSWEGVAVESHPPINWWTRNKSVTMRNQMNKPNVDRWTKCWSPDDKWEFIEDHMRPACLKLNLGCGETLLDGWTGLDPRSHLDERIIEWDFNRHIPFAEWTADVVMTSHVFNYIAEEDYATALLDIWRVLRPGGVLRMAEDCTDSGYVWREIGKPARGTGEIKSLPTKTKIVAALKRVGFDIHEGKLDETLSPHKDILNYNSRYRRYRLGHKFYIEAVKSLVLREKRALRMSDKRRKRDGTYVLPKDE